MATEILVNDGGAPARILPFEAGAAITAGDVLEVHTDGKVRPATTDTEPAAGVAMVAAASGDMCSVISGSGIIVRVVQNTNLAAGALVMVDTGNVGEVIAHTGTASATKEPIGMTLEDVAAGALVKVLLF
tara:strand:+ start:209 stop:598 length:390 start_codon:yes stop_codon:yes gene_type:complete